MIETLPVIHFFYNHRVINLFSSKVADLNCRSCHSKVIFGNLGTSLGKYRAEGYCRRTFHESFDGYLFYHKLHALIIVFEKCIATGN